MLISLGQGLAGASHRDTIAALLATALRALLAPDSLLLVLTDADSGTRRVAHALNIRDPRADDPLIERALKGASVDGSWLGSPIRGAAGRTIGAVYAVAGGGSGFDERHLEMTTAALTQAAIALENSRLVELLSDGKREWEQTVDAVSEAFCVLGGDGRVLRANRAFGQLAQHPLTALAGRPWMSLLPEDWAGPIAQALAAPERGGVELLAGGRLFTVTALTVAEDGTCVLVFADQTDKKRLQEQLIQSEKMSAIGQLIAGVAHDLNNPLASVVGFADYLLETEKDAGPHLLEPLRAIQQEAVRAAGIVHNLLSFARKQDRRRREQRIGPVIEATLFLLRNQLMACRVDSHLHIDPELPDVRMDANQVQQVFVNLINNAAQAVQGTARAGNIWIRVTRWLDGIAVTFEDDGPGIADQIADKVFEPFFTTKPEGQGTGLGLSICQGIVREHGGRITLSKRAGGGAALRVELPGASTPPRVESQEPATGTLGILVVDDEPHILHYLRATLEAWGHRVAVAADGETALVRARGESFDVIITDVRMPRFGGREFYESLNRERPELAAHVIFSTGDTVRGDTLQFLESLGRPFLQKPFSLAQLRSALGAATQG
ncbi:MAG: response regulator [Gemmatimonadetes bacterium]|nr:response regulator [Gemmatimonadota bacterium]